MEPTPGLKIAHYELLARLGAGGMGEVWRALDHSLQREVAVKFIAHGALAHPGRLARFQREARAASALNHPNIVTVHEFGEEDDRPYIVLELVQGRSLRELMVAGRLPLARALDIAAQMADGLARAHAAGIVHRDLKPDNVMVTGDGLVKLLDFGLAKLVTPAGGEAPGTPDPAAVTQELSADDGTTVSRTHEGMVLGTVGYMSPEQARGREIDHRSDQFSLGSILYEMLSGHRAFQKASTMETLMAIIGEPPQLPAPEMPAPLRWILERLLAKDPARRYASTLDLARELREVGGRVDELRGKVPGGLRRPRRRLLRAAAAAAAIAAAAVVLSPVRERVAGLLGAPPAVPRRGHVAVLPFRYVGANPQGPLLCEGLVDILNGKLTQLEQFQGALTVVPAAEVTSAGVSTPSAARRRFGATLVVTGTVQESAGRMRAQASLVEADTLRQVRSVEVEEAAGDLFRLEDRLLERLIEMLRMRTGDGGHDVLAFGETRMGDAYAAYVEARGLLQRYDRPGNLAAATAALKVALEKDPGYALAHAGLCEAHWLQYQQTRQADLVDLARAECRRAVELERRLPAVFVTLAMLERGTGQPAAALAHADNALALDPVRGEAYRERARALEDLGRLPEAEQAYRKASALRPDDWSVHNQLGGFLLARGRFEEARAAFRRVTELAPDNVQGWNNMGTVAYAQDDLAEARRAWEASAAIASNAIAWSNLGTLAFFQGRYADAVRAFEEAVKTRENDHRLWANLAAARYWAPGQRESAAAAYEKALQLAQREQEVTPGDGRLLARIATAEAFLGRAEGARTAIARALALSPRDARVLFAAAEVYERVGDRGRALRMVKAALDAGYSRREVMAAPSLAGLRNDRRFPPAPAS